MSEKLKLNSNAIVTLTLGILSILIPFIGFVLGVIGIVVSRKATKEIAVTHEDGRGLAISGLICSVVGIIMQVFAVLGIIAFIYFVDTQVSIAGLQDSVNGFFQYPSSFPFLRNVEIE